MLNLIYFIFPVIAFALCFVFYRKGLSDGLEISEGRNIKTAPAVKIKIPSKNDRILSAEQQRLQRGIQNILEYKEGGNTNEKQK